MPSCIFLTFARYLERMIKRKLQEMMYTVMHPLVMLSVRFRINPNFYTLIGLLLNVAAALIFIRGSGYPAREALQHVGWGGVLILLGGFFDLVDGRVARVGGTSSAFGALFDSVIDRYSELIMFFGICYFLIAQGYVISSIFGFLALIGSIMVSYTRARAEGLGIDCSVGMMQRPERILLVSISAILCGFIHYFAGVEWSWRIPGVPFTLFEPIAIFTLPLSLVAILANYTAVQRLLYSYGQLRK